MAITRAQKKVLLEQYGELVQQSQALYLLSYHALSVPEIQALRKTLKHHGARWMVVKNTLLRRVLEEAQYPLPEDGGVFEGPTAAVFVMEDPVAAAKTLVKAIKDLTQERLNFKGGYLETEFLTAEQVKQLAELPSLPELRAQLLALIMTPATQLVRLLQEPARQLAAVIKAYSEQSSETSEAAA